MIVVTQMSVQQQHKIPDGSILKRVISADGKIF